VENGTQRPAGRDDAVRSRGIFRPISILYFPVPSEVTLDSIGSRYLGLKVGNYHINYHLCHLTKVRDDNWRPLGGAADVVRQRDTSNHDGFISIFV